jgi:hypothetical protein
MRHGDGVWLRSFLREERKNGLHKETKAMATNIGYAKGSVYTADDAFVYFDYPHNNNEA